MISCYLGGMFHGDAYRLQPGQREWRSSSDEHELIIGSRLASVRLFTWDSLAILIRGNISFTDSFAKLDWESISHDLRHHYLEHGDLAIDGLDGSFTIVLLDAVSRQILMYRNLVGTGFTYYHVGRDGFLFGSNLASLVHYSRVSPRENLLVLPSFFLYRFVPGADTLFDGFYRLLPGERVTWDGRAVSRCQFQTFAGLKSDKPIGSATVALNQTMKCVLNDSIADSLTSANLLSGGVDSSYIQTAWNQIHDQQPLHSYSLSVDHARTRSDTEYALSASVKLKTRHKLVAANGPYVDYLVDLLSLTGEPPNHVQSAYFGCLARSIRSDGFALALCGEGADSLFGLGLANEIHIAGLARNLFPSSRVREFLAVMCQLVGFGKLSAAMRLADHLSDFAYHAHPVNCVASFTDLSAVQSCFGLAAVAEASADRRSYLERFDVPSHPLDRLHATGYLCEAVDSASLWTTVFNSVGVDLCCPFLDSRILRFALSLPHCARYPFRQPKELLKRALAQFVGDELSRRPKLGFGQPVFEWLQPGGQLRSLAERLGRHDFVDPATLDRSLRQPNWFLYSLLCYDLWHRLFIERSLAPSGANPLVSSELYS